MTDDASLYNPLINNLKMPGKMVKLPSLGAFYEDGVLDKNVKNGELHIYPLTTYDELMLKSIDFMINGDSIIQVFKNCIPGVIDPLKLFVKDFDFLIMHLRVLSYGNEMEIFFNHSCENAKRHSYVIDVNKILASSKPLDATTFHDRYTHELPNGQIIGFKPIIVKEFIELSKLNENSPVIDEQYEYIMASLTSVIDYVKNSQDEKVFEKQLIREWLNKIPSDWFRGLIESINSNSPWGADTTTTLSCKDCKHDIIADVPLNPIIFFSKHLGQEIQNL